MLLEALKLVPTVGKVILPIIAGLNLAIPVKPLLTAVVIPLTVVRNLIIPTALVPESRKVKEEVPRIGKERVK